MRRLIIIIGAAFLLFLFTKYGLVPEILANLRSRTERTLQTHFESKVEFSDFDVSLLPRLRMTVSGLVMRHKGRTDITPLIRVREASMYANPLSLLQKKLQISFMELKGLEIHTPPRRPGDEPLIQRTDEDLAKKYPVHIRELRANDAVIVILRSQPEKPPREFRIHRLLLHDLSFDRPARFHAVLTNPIPAGVIEAAGEFGPWLPDAPSKTPAVGQYIFQNADLGTLKGLKGILSSKGEFSGPLDYLSVNGATDTPDFNLRMADHPMALHTDFSAVVDGTNGDTYLNSVTARFLHTTLAVSGKVVDINPEVKGRTIVLDARSGDARVEDLIRLAVKTDEPILFGSAKLKMKINIPAGDSDLIDRLKLKGQFVIDDAQFTSPEMQGKIDTLSRKGQGRPMNMDINSVVSKMKGNFMLSDGIVTFSNLNFGVAGASLDLSGTYNLDSEALDFHGKLMLQAKLSQTTTGAKSFFLKALDPFFNGRNAGTVLQIKITGTKGNPKFELDHGEDSNTEESPPQTSN